MWVFLNDSFLSIVAHRHQPNALLVRARVAGDIERAFPGATVTNTPEADYPFRATLPRAVVGERLATLAGDLGYTNFKNSVREPDRHDAYFDTWATMRQFQNQRKEEPPHA